MQNNHVDGVVLGLDIGDSRIGVARAHSFAKLPEPLTVIIVAKQDPVMAVTALINETDTQLVIVGLPKLASGSDSGQTLKVRRFVDTLRTATTTPILFIDESFSSQDADRYIKAHQKQVVSNDAIAACVILERYFESTGAL
jgi:putative Holliday junction resolvase